MSNLMPLQIVDPAYKITEAGDNHSSGTAGPVLHQLNLLANNLYRFQEQIWMDFSSDSWA